MYLYRIKSYLNRIKTYPLVGGRIEELRQNEKAPAGITLSRERACQRFTILFVTCQKERFVLNYKP